MKMSKVKVIGSENAKLVCRAYVVKSGSIYIKTQWSSFLRRIQLTSENASFLRYSFACLCLSVSVCLVCLSHTLLTRNKNVVER